MCSCLCLFDGRINSKKYWEFQTGATETWQLMTGATEKKPLQSTRLKTPSGPARPKEMALPLRLTNFGRHARLRIILETRQQTFLKSRSFSFFLSCAISFILSRSVSFFLSRAISFFKSQTSTRVKKKTIEIKNVRALITIQSQLSVKNTSLGKKWE